MATKIRSSSQLYVDDNLVVNGKKITSLAAGGAAGEAVEYAQLNSAIANAISGVGSSIHVPVQTVALAKAVAAAGRADKMILLIEDLGLYRFDDQMIAISNDATVIRPTDVASDSAAGRWVKISSTITDHDLLSNLLGNGGYHLSLAERDKLTNIEATADVTDAANVGSAINGVAAKATPVDADSIPLLDSTAGNSLKKFTWANLKTTLITAFDLLYQAKLGFTPENTANEDASSGYVGMTLFKHNFKNAAGTIVSWFTNSNTVARTYTFPDRTGTIADDTDITGAKARANHTGTQVAATISDFAAAVLLVAPPETAQTIGTIVAGTAAKATPVDADNIGFSDSAATNVIKKFTFANLKTWIFSLFTGDVTVNGSGITAIGANKVGNAMLGTVATATIKGRATAGTGNVEDLNMTQLKALLGLVAGNMAVRVYHATPSGTVNGSNAAFIIPVVVLSGSESVFKNGLLQNAGAGNDYQVAYNTPVGSTTITFESAPSNTPFVDTILVNYNA
jgi:hypothetical protein